MIKKKLNLIGYASGLAGADVRCGEGPIVVQQSPYLKELTKQNILLDWQILRPANNNKIKETVKALCEELATKTSALIRNNALMSVVGGDHSCALGTWSGLYDALHDKGDIGLIWIDAHMDSHTNDTSETGRIHGMPLASLLGFGEPSFTHILHAQPKLKPENVCLIGVRSFERGEFELLKKLNVKIYFIDEVKERSFETVLKEAIGTVSQHTVGYGISLDIDSIDPSEAPGVDVPEPNGISVKEMWAGLRYAAKDPKLLILEIVEFDPAKDRDHLTEKLVVQALEIFAKNHQATSDALSA